MSDQSTFIRTHVGAQGARERGVYVQLQMPLQSMETLESHTTHITHAILLARISGITQQQRIRDRITRVFRVRDVGGGTVRRAAGCQAQERLNIAEIVSRRAAVGLKLKRSHQARLIVQQLFVHLYLMPLKIAASLVRRIANHTKHLRVFVAISVDSQSIPGRE